MNRRLEFILIIYCVGSGKFCLEFITSMVTPIFPSVIFKWQNLSSFNSSDNVSGFDKFDYSQLSILYGTKNICQVIVSMTIGFIVDRIGDLETLLIGMMLQGVAVVLYGVGSVYFVLILGRIFEGISSTTIQCSVSAYIAYKFKSQDNRGKWFGYVSLCMYLAGSVGPSYGGFVYQYYSKTLAFLLILIPITFHLIPLIILLVNKRLIIKVKERKLVTDNSNHMETLVNSNKNSSSNIANIKENIKSEVMNKGSYIRFLLDPYFLIAMNSYPVLFMTYYILYATLPRYLKKEFGITEFQQGLIWSLTAVGYLLGFILGNILNTKLQNRRHYVLVVILFVNSFTSVIVCAMPYWWMFAFPVCLIFTQFLVFDMFCPPILSKITEKKHDKQYGKMAGLMLTGTSITSSIWSSLGPILLKKIGLFKLNIIIYCVNLLYIPLIFFLKDFSVK
uniref:Slc18a-5 n=1 Tax=Schmidtea mediterranea TaxID=79327 RepID=A0A0H3YF28_SCHMD|nr:slc18a-5 [Schmidtea mediterranea]